MESGKVLRIEFTYFAVWIAPMCPNDYVNVTDGDGTTLMGKGCGYINRSPTSSGYFKPPIITTMTNTVDIFFHTDGSGTQNGWSLNWTAVTPGLKPLLATLTQNLQKSTILLSCKLGKQKRPSSHLKGCCVLGFFVIQVCGGSMVPHHSEKSSRWSQCYWNFAGAGISASSRSFIQSFIKGIVH